MGLLDSILASALKGSGGQADAASQGLPNVLSQILGRTDLGSIGGLLAMLQKSGLDRQVASWLGNGTNMPISPDQLRNALGQGHLQQMGQAAGISQDELTKVLSQFLPGAVDHMSPKGVLEEPDHAGNDDGDGRSLAQQAGLDDIK
jgi:uncharacterized protein YidB (DUF937 family)